MGLQSRIPSDPILDVVVDFDTVYYVCTRKINKNRRKWGGKGAVVDLQLAQYEGNHLVLHN